MGKKRLYFYECVMTVDVAYMAPQHRQDMKQVGQFGFDSDKDQLVQHNIRLKPADPLKRRGADILCSEKPIAKHFLEVYEKQVSRHIVKDGMPVPGRREMRSKITKVKFRLMEQSEIAQVPADRIKYIRLRSCDLEEVKVREPVA